MIDLKQVHDMWQKDCVIDSYQLDDTSRKTPILHSKYIQLWSTAKLELKRAEFDQKTLLKEKWLFYYGKMDQETVKEKGWVPDAFEIQKSEEKIQYLKTVIDTLTEIIDNLKWRHQTISNMIRWKQFESGN